MARRSVLWPDSRVKPPFGSVEIDPSRPRPLRWWLFNEAAGVPSDVCNLDRTATKTTGATWTTGPHGLRMTFAADTDAVTPGDVAHGNGPITVCMRGKMPTFSVDRIFLQIGGTGIDAYHLGYTSGNAWRWTLTGIAHIASSLTATAGREYSVVMAYTRATSCRFSVFDLSTATLTTQTVNDATSPGTGFTTRIGNSQAMAEGWVQALDTIAVHPRILSDAEMTEWHATPYAGLRPIIRRRYFVAAAAGGGLSIPVAMHTYKQRRVVA